MRPVPGGVVIALLLILITVVGIVADQPGYGITFYAVIPIVLAAFWFGRAGALATAGLATVIFVGRALIFRTEAWSGEWLWVATLNRTVIYFVVAVIVSSLLDRERQLRHRVEQQDRQLDELQSIREALTPTEIPDRPGLELATAFIPAEGPIAGDFFLVAPGPANSTTFVVGDVVGHGFAAARRASFVRAVLATSAPFSSNPAQLLQLANTSLTEHLDVTTGFVTAVCVNVSPLSGQLKWASAGHDPPWLLDSGEKIGGGQRSLPLGLMPKELHLETTCRTLRSGEGFLLFTDGLIEGRTVHGDPSMPLALFGEERVRETLASRLNASPKEVVYSLATSVKDFAGGALADDVCIVGCRLTAGCSS